MASYSLSGPVDCNIDFDSSNLAGKTAVVTGGASGIGEGYVRALVAAKVTVCFGDKDEEAGRKLVSELNSTKFVPCDTTKWEDQVHLFKEAAAFSPSGKIHYVVANAGITRQDDVFSFDGNDQEPAKPNLSIVDVNLYGVLYTVKLTLHYFIKQNGTEVSPSQEDTCLVLIGSGAAYFDVPRSVQYPSTKWAMRGIMHGLRRTAPYYGSRVNLISPWYVRTKILTQAAFDHVEKSGVQFATVEDAGQCLLRILSDHTINGRSLFVSARKWAPRGYLDLDLDEYHGNDLVEEIQVDQIRSKPVELGLFP
ncbi:Adam [Pleurostoma richardsiae]|uniref:Adam n=1 Tax=Pleurostoma richardsiae TaxID=41990 RepID=A0AA38VIP4_9PEZI|nr:Adam [Pleurostoma richardsiae]